MLIFVFLLITQALSRNFYDSASFIQMRLTTKMTEDEEDNLTELIIDVLEDDSDDSTIEGDIIDDIILVDDSDDITLEDMVILAITENQEDIDDVSEETTDEESEEEVSDDDVIEEDEEENEEKDEEDEEAETIPSTWFLELNDEIEISDDAEVTDAEMPEDAEVSDDTETEEDVESDVPEEFRDIEPSDYLSFDPQEIFTDMAKEEGLEEVGLV